MRGILLLCVCFPHHARNPTQGLVLYCSKVNALLLGSTLTHKHTLNPYTVSSAPGMDFLANVFTLEQGTFIVYFLFLLKATLSLFFDYQRL